MRLFDTKSGDNVFPALTQRAIAVLENIPRKQGDARVFPVSREAVNAAWDRACKACDLDDFRFHDTRHVGTTRLARRLRNPEALRAITGHKTYAMLQRYLHVMHDDVLEMLDATEPGTAYRAPEPPARAPRRPRAKARDATAQPAATAGADAVAQTAVVVDFAQRLRERDSLRAEATRKEARA